MADILIRGMEMPKHCSECFVKQCKRARYYVDPWPIFGDLSSRPENCPLIALPEGHGRLVDADVLNKLIDKSYSMTDRVDVHNGYAICQELIKQLPTIVPAEKEDKNG